MPGASGRWLYSFFRGHAVFAIALLAAIITSCIIRPGAEYIGYFDFNTLVCLFCTLAVICALKRVAFFDWLSTGIIVRLKNLRRVIVALVCITFISSMIIANDMALITFLPLGYYILTKTGQQKHMAFVFIMQNIAANLGGMLTPFGNPQNLYLYSYFHIPTLEFLQIMSIPFFVSIALILLCCVFTMKKQPLEIPIKTELKDVKRTIIYIIAFIFAIIIVFRFVPYWIGLIVIPIIIGICDHKALKDVDYPLLLTFTAFFIFAGNMSRIEAVNSLLSSLMQKNTLLFATISCQFISNVPSAVLLSHFTANYPQLLVAVNIGGVGTLIASLASLITFTEYRKHNEVGILKYIAKFSAYNFSMLFILTALMYVLLCVL
jgi:Na+/H+ antiporter NhaD/arsenite permease-like protein